MSTWRKLCSCDLSVDGSVVLEDCTGYRRMKDALLQYFKHEAFRPGQLEALLPLAHGKDVFVRMRTGGGKSLCMFLVPLAMCDNALGIVVSPLVSLMDQQVSMY